MSSSPACTAVEAARAFISYRRDDAAGYAGRLEEALERRLGPGSVFRDILDIAPGDDYAASIGARLAGAWTVLVLIGPRWAGGDTVGQRRIDRADDLVRIEVAMALHGGRRVVPVLLAGTPMPAAASLPDALKPLAERNAMVLGEAHWEADVDRLAALIGGGTTLPKRRRAVLGAAAAVAAVAMAIGAAAWWGRPPDAAQALLGEWQGDVRYDWGDRHVERFVFRRHAGELTGTASFLGYPRAIERLRLTGANLHFDTHSLESVGDSTRQLTHRYAAELQGRPPDEQLVFRLQISGGHGSHAPLDFVARRVGPEGAAGRP